MRWRCIRESFALCRLGGGMRLDGRHAVVADSHLATVVLIDHHAIIGPAPNVEGLYFVNGFSGHGVMHSPASGRITADLILQGNSGLIDASQLSVERFKKGKLLEETAVL